jgi:hypothetical protein
VLNGKFEHRAPSHQNAVEIFCDHWASKIESVYPGLRSGLAPMFTPEDARPGMAAQHLGFVPNSLHGMSVLELGPLEGAHTYQLAKLGAGRILAIEANAEAFLKCLVVKEILRTPRCSFMLGDCLTFLQLTDERFDLIFCSGILYHMENPYELIKAISRCSDRVFLWTHYYDPEISIDPPRRAKSVKCDDVDLVFYEQDYGDPNYGRFWGGLKPTSSWMTKDAISQCFERFGYEFVIRDDTRVHPGGPNICGTAVRRRGDE